MNIQSLLLVALAVAVLPGTSRADNDNNFQNWSGGDGVWDVGNTADWNNPNPLSDGQLAGPSSYFNTNDRNFTSRPTFVNAPGTITVDDSFGTPIFGEMDFFGNGNWTLTGGDIDNISSNNSATVVYVASNVGNVTINNTINIAPNPTNNGSIFTNNAVGTTLKLGNLNISSIPQSGTDAAGQYNNKSAPFSYDYGFNNQTQMEVIQTVNSQNLLLWAATGTTIEIDGNYTTDPNLFGGMVIGQYGNSAYEGTVIFKGGLDENTGGGKQFDFGSGNIIFATSDTGTGPMTFVGAGANLPQTLLTQGAQTISNNIQPQGASNAIIGGSDASASTFSGTINAGGGGGELDLRAAAGGTVTFSGLITGDNNATTKDGTGTVILSNAMGNSWTTYIPDTFEMKAGKTLIMNTSGDAFGNGAANGNVGSVFAQIDSKAILGGTGVTFQKVVAAAADSIISPGTDSKINTIRLFGGLSTTSHNVTDPVTSAVTSVGNGLTLDFKLGGLIPNSGIPIIGVNNDAIDMGVGNLTLNGPITVNFTVVGSVITGTPYTLIFSNSVSDWSGSLTPVFDITPPAGYELDKSYAMGGYDFNTTSSGDIFSGAPDTFTVEFEAIPEPSTYGLIGFGFLALVAMGRFRRLSA